MRNPTTSSPTSTSARCRTRPSTRSYDSSTTSVRRAASLLIAGDLFDFWFEYGEVIPGRHFRTLAALARPGGRRLARLHGRRQPRRLGRPVPDGARRADLPPGPVPDARSAGRRALVAHGDGLGTGDIKYRALKAVIRSRAASGAFRVLHPELGLRLARAVSRTEARADADLAAAGAAGSCSWAASNSKPTGAGHGGVRPLAPARPARTRARPLVPELRRLDHAPQLLHRGPC
jgi:UDP-2,3-diacylglucosamine pyrophosphatase LpxH